MQDQSVAWWHIGVLKATMSKKQKRDPIGLSFVVEYIGIEPITF